MGDFFSSTLEEMCEFVIDCPHFTPEWKDNGFIVIRNQNIRDGRLDLSDPSFTHLEDFQRRIKRAKPKGGDIVFTREAPMGEVCLIPDGLECCIGQRQVLLRPKYCIDGRYLFFALRSQYVRHQIFWNEGAGSTVSNVRIPAIKALKIPRLGESESPIAEILGALDDKIELNRQTNATLEAMARVLFKDWFVDFGPTRAKAEGRAPYLASHLWERFPDALDDEDKPVGWTIEPLLDHARLISGGTPKTDVTAYWHGPIAWASAKDVSQCSDAFLIETERNITPRGLEESSTRLIPKNATVVVARGATTGRYCLFGAEMAMNQTCYALASPKQWPFWLNCAFGFVVQELVHSAHGSVFDTITTKTIQQARLTVAGRDLISRFEETVTPLFSRIHANLEESRTLAQTRDLLLPKLMSGEIRLREAERIAEAVL